MSDSVKKYYEDDFERKIAASGSKNFKILSQHLDNEKRKDPVVEKVKREFDIRSKIGISKYGKTLAENDLSLLQWLQHAKEEAMDQALYLQCIIDELTNKQSSI